jgi:benzoate/toluate 1,2-dioxygenase beta subunit
MVADAETLAATQLLYREALFLDRQDWKDWLALYIEDAVFWVPTWKDDGEPTSDPEAELSLIYCASREQLKERAERVSGGRSIASLPPLRTAHTVSNVLVEDAGSGSLRVNSVATTHVYNIKKREQNVFFSLQEHLLQRIDGGGYAIARKKLLLLNDYIPRMIDFYTI